MDECLSIPQEFINENKNAVRNLVKPSQKYSPYTKKERHKRRLEVFRLHMDIGYSAVRISELLKVNRNTINQDIKWCYQQINIQSDLTPSQILDKQLFRYESQRARLVNSLTNASTVQERLVLEKLILDLDSKITSMMLKINDYATQATYAAMKGINDYLDKHHKNDDFPRFVLKAEFNEVTPETRKKIDELIANGKQWHSCKVNRQ